MSSSILNEFKNTTNKVQFLLKNYKSLRNNDIKLWISYLVLYHNLQTSLTSAQDSCQAFCDLILDNNVPSISSIIRVRQKLQENNLYPKIKEVNKREKKTGIKNNIVELLKKHKPLRDNDKKLWLAYLVEYHNLKDSLNNSTDPYETLCDILIDDIPAMDTIRRFRQHIQEAGMYLGSNKRQRLVAAKKVKKK